MDALLAVYGTLREGGRLHHHLGTTRGRARQLGTAVVAGVLHEVAPAERDTTVVDTSYPCLTLDPGGRVVVELYAVVDPTLLDHLDELEGYDPADPAGSEYVRVRVPLLDVAPATLDARDAWTYVYVQAAPDPTRRIPGGDWIEHARTRR